MSVLTYGSVCSGIEAASVAWAPLGWEAAFVAEIEAAPRAVLQHRFPEVPLHGDFTTIQDGDYPAIDLLVGGTPCQDFSVAGLRAGLDGERGSLTLEFGRLAGRLRPRWVAWENVPGVLSNNEGRDFAAVLGLLSGQIVSVPVGGWQNSGVLAGYRNAYGLAWRVLDAQYVRVDGYGRAVPQRRRRVFVVGHLGDWRRPAAVLLERACLRGDPAPRREAGAGAAIGALAGTGPGGGWRIGPDEAAAGQLVLAYGGNDTRGPIQVATAVNAHGGPHGRLDFESETFIAFDTTQITSAQNRNNPQPGDPCHPLAAGAHPPAIAFSCKDYGADATDMGATPTMRAMGHSESHANAGGQLAVAIGHNGGPAFTEWAVRRLTPLECERLQGFSDGWTAVPWRGGTMADGPRYKMLGNSMAVNVMRWIGRRIEAVDALAEAPSAAA
ncbi:DNA cytosine methyltransferase [Methylobacterium pseudosasicola]|uniref:DNA (cytosine-5-)-methyltransferase n=1 Tax=Methylobacterium pseudosasicola TaxID=582667 RepID=A0A1I4V7H3_9HYPH|nr:DNA cytosine methyltransferase [Methylobacterium pseudosasicola]SFM97137.1 DNA (cytosine-5)-methyltransferase 1 [Methylobacterium pseudosasicola]